MAKSFWVFTLLFVSGLAISDEFDVARFQNSQFACVVDADCGFGTCQNAKCFCTLGYRDSVDAPCDHQMGQRDQNTAWILETALGLIVPAGWFYMDLWPMALARLGVEAVAGALTFSYFYHRTQYLKDFREEERGPFWLMLFTGIAWAGHLTFWIERTVFLADFGTSQARNSKKWHKDLGEADVVVLADKVVDSIRITLNTFAPDSCTIVEGCIDGPGERRLLRWDEYIHNKGTADFVKGLESQARPIFSPCHQHYHGINTASHFIKRQLVNSSGGVTQEVVVGHKAGYCYIDSAHIKGDYDPKFDCGVPYFTRDLTQGITAGWSDIYNSDTDCQWIDITGVPNGTYQLYLTVNPGGIYYQDSNLTNNRAVLEIVIPPVDHKAERSRYGTFISSTIVSGEVSPNYVAGSL